MLCYRGCIPKNKIISTYPIRLAITAHVAIAYRAIHEPENSIPRYEYFIWASGNFHKFE